MVDSKSTTAKYMAERFTDKEYKPTTGDEFKKIYGSTSPPGSIAEKIWNWLVKEYGLTAKEKDK